MTFLKSSHVTVLKCLITVNASLSQLPGPSMHLPRPVSMHPPHHPVTYKLDLDVLV